MKDALEGFKALLKAMRSKDDKEFMDEDMEFMCVQVKSFAGYVKAVSDALFDVALARERYAGDPACLQAAVTACDRKRKIAHDSAISACSVLNRACDRFGAERFCPETEDRTAIANFCARATDSVFWNGVAKVEDIDSAISKTDEKDLRADEVDRVVRRLLEEN